LWVQFTIGIGFLEFKVYLLIYCFKKEEKNLGKDLKIKRVEQRHGA
jgi:hypothetical protein